MLLLVEKLLANLDFREECTLVQFLDRTRLLVLTRLLKIDTLAWAVERYFALLAATLRADASVNCRTEALFLAFVANRTAQNS